MTTLYCDSKGDKRFSALYANVKLKDGTVTTIERYYQSVKRTANESYVRKGEHVDHLIINGRVYPPQYLTPLYRKLWVLYFEQNPELLAYAATFDNFVDRFKGRAINCQADVIRDLVNKYKKKGECVNK